MKTNDINAYARRVRTMSSAALLLADPTLEWDSAFTLEIRVWIMAYMARSMNSYSDEHYEAYELAKLLIADGN